MDIDVPTLELEMLNVTMINNGTINVCRELSNFTKDEVMSLLAPNDVWEKRSNAWYVIFDLTIAVYILLFIILALAALIMLFRRHLVARFKVRTFVAIDLALLTLGVSRALFLSLDPWGQNGYFTCTGCTIVSRLIACLAFPSLTASYTLVFITLWISAKRMQLGSLWIQKLKVIVPLCFVHYAVAVSLEIIATLQLPAYHIMIVLIVCEAIFAVWGICASVGFMMAGTRLLKMIKRSARTSSVVCKDSPHMTRHDLVVKKEPATPPRYRTRTQFRYKEQEKHRRTVRKIARITYFTASLATLYSVLVMINLTYIIVNLFHQCAGYIGDAKLHPEFWLIFHILMLTVELLLGVLLTYSIVDYYPAVVFLRTILMCGGKLKSSKIQEKSTQKNLSEDTYS